MKKIKLIFLTVYLLTLILSNGIFAQNPFILDQFSADPSARIFGDSVYVFPSHDIPTPSEKPGRKNWFCMADYHVFSSANLTDWNDHGVIVSQNEVKWVDSNAYAMWAPDCIYKNGKYYFYFPAPAKDTSYGRGFSIGVAVSDNPYGPYKAQTEPIKNVRGIDPNVFIDKDGQAYLYWSARNIFVAKLKDNMIELASEPQVISNLPEKGLKEGPFLFERNGIYYLTFPHAENKTERLEYAMGNSPLGPFKMTGVIMDESSTGCWTNHHSFINLNNQWYLFYHNSDLSPKFDKNRSIRIDSMFFNIDGTIQKVIPTLRGVGLTTASQQIQIDRYSRIGITGVSTTFLDTLNTFNGWKVLFNASNAWIQYNGVDFGSEKYKTVQIKALSEKGGTIQIRLDNINGPLLSEINITKDVNWNIFDMGLLKYQQGIHNLIIVLKNNNPVELDWIRFLK
jgi:hypothetical protein